MKLDSDFLERWAAIVSDVEKRHCPVSCVKKVVFKFVNNKQKTINFKKLREKGMTEQEIESAIGDFITSNESNIGTMELVVDVEAVANIVQPETDKLLKGI